MMQVAEMIDKDKLINIVESAGQILLDAHLESNQIYCKSGEANFVTYYDKTIQSFIIKEIKQLCPEAVFYGEETTEGNTQQVAENGITFFIDPIDGTTNFLFDYHHSCVSVGVAVDGVLQAGFVYNPYVKEMFHAVRGKGSWCNDRRLQMKNLELKDGIVAFGCARYNEDHTDLLFDTMKKLFYKSLSIRNGGSAALDLCRIAAGRNAAYLEMKLQPYDYAAAAVIIEEAGGMIGQIDGCNITLDRPCSILAGTINCCTQIRQILNV